MSADIGGYFRVTEILEYFPEQELVEWMVKTGKAKANRVKRGAMKVGATVDSMFKDFISGKMPNLKKIKNQEVVSCFKGFLKWYEDYNNPALKIGERLFDEELRITGEPDLIDIHQTVIDVKCASKIRLKYWLQTAAYQLLRKSTAPIAVLRLHKHLEDYEYQIRNDTEYLQRVFLSLFDVYRFYNGIKEPMAQGVTNASSPTDDTIRNKSQVD